MYASKGFTLIEIIVTMIIIGVMAVVVIPSYGTYVEQGAAKAAQNNLVAIYNAEKNFYYSNNYYCSTSAQNATCADSIAHMNIAANLNLNITDTNFSYACYDPNSASDANDGSAFTCTATNNGDPNLILTVTGGPPNDAAIILPGGTGCATNGPWAAPCNPTCVTNITAYCPTA